MNVIGGKKSIFFYFRNSLLLWIMGIFLLPNIAFASSITPANLIELTNQERAKYNLPKLTINELLTKAAEQKAEAIFAVQKFSHNFADKKFSGWIKEQGYQYSIVGENLAINFTASEPLFNAWLASPMHKKNILHDDFREIGLAIKTSYWLGEETTLVVELFGAPPALAEQSVPDTFSHRSPFLSYQNPAQLITSNLAENYLNNIAADNTPAVAASKQIITKNFIIKNKTAAINYLLTAVKITLIYTAVMLLLVLCYFYAVYFAKLYKKLQLMAK
ncbi:hypothetical protein COU00_02215 [Candidatus Falkowbacteria bacterium CG10_big_fil_rev_8_21_14_0_10_43_11]|uniref:SCP domain-containing protein n=1 Tax=Candidatus Falkowbacteria bacterium CG10_big_fil_rev_8_21_14_0_10_43_11 TaxID=1974568 RepID=A0A2M6WM21_9BACT|nr:MAG: hypothetical protein COU00_02215 [Candidatus Falkowbacteria bacterium CG10_big_fil_rev_8_21_14_0_10_43_11]